MIPTPSESFFIIPNDDYYYYCGAQAAQSTASTPVACIRQSACALQFEYSSMRAECGGMSHVHHDTCNNTTYYATLFNLTALRAVAPSTNYIERGGGGQRID